MDLSDFDYELPPELIAQEPAVATTGPSCWWHEVPNRRILTEWVSVPIPSQLRNPYSLERANAVDGVRLNTPLYVK